MTTSIKSTNNFTTIPLEPGRIYIGSYDTVLPYATAIISINTDTDTELIVYSSTNKIRTTTIVYQTEGGTPFFKFINITNPYMYFTVRNVNVSTAQTYLTFEVIYREVSVSVSSGGVGSNVNIFDSNGNTLNSTSNALNVFSTNTNTITKNSSVIWNNTSISAGDVSSLFADAHNINNQSVSIFGHSSENTTIGILVSNDNISYFYLQSVITVIEDTDFGFSLILPFKYLKLYSTETTTITAIICFC